MADIAELLHQGIAAAKAGQNERARDLLLQVIDQDDSNEQAWLWLSSVVESLDDRRLCLQNVVAINPDNVYAQAGLRQLKAAVASPLVEESVAPPLVEGQDLDLESTPLSPQPSPPMGEGVEDDTARLVAMAQSYLMKMQNVPEAIDLLNWAIEAQPANGQAYLLLGDAYLQQDDLSQAARYYSRASRHTAPDSRLGREARLKLMVLQESVQPEAVAPVAEYAGSVSATDMQRSVEPRRTSGNADRPGCVTLYAALAALAGLLAVVGGFLVALAGTSVVSYLQKMNLSLNPSLLDIYTWLAVGVGVGTATACLAIAAGLWRMKNWARIVVVVTNILGVLSFVCPAVALFATLRPALEAGLPTAVWVIPLAGLVLVCGATYWFATNRELFD
jgi:tetratricopeptide (TPR) repeat protein